MTLPATRLPESNDTVILDRLHANLTVTLASGTHTIRKIHVRETLHLTGGSLTVGYVPSLDSTAIAAQISGPDFDGNLNLTEYALLGSPNSSSPTELFTRGVSGGKLTIAFQRDITRNDITIRVQSSSTLSGAWADEAVSVNGAAFTPAVPATVVETGAGNVKSVTFTDSSSSCGSGSRSSRLFEDWSGRGRVVHSPFFHRQTRRNSSSSGN